MSLCECDSNGVCMHCNRRLKNCAAKRQCRASASVVAEFRELPAHGVGMHLHLIIEKLGFTVRQNCGCMSRAAIMDAWGPDECEKNIDQIIEWLRAEAENRGIPFVSLIARLLVKRAISKARADAGKIG